MHGLPLQGLPDAQDYALIPAASGAADCTGRSGVAGEQDIPLGCGKKIDLLLVFMFIYFFMLFYTQHTNMWNAYVIINK